MTSQPSTPPHSRSFVLTPPQPHLPPQLLPLLLRVVRLVVPELLPALVLTQAVQVLHQPVHGLGPTLRHTPRRTHLVRVTHRHRQKDTRRGAHVQTHACRCCCKSAASGQSKAAHGLACSCQRAMMRGGRLGQTDCEQMVHNSHCSRRSVASAGGVGGRSALCCMHVGQHCRGP